MFYLTFHFGNLYLNIVSKFLSNNHVEMKYPIIYIIGLLKLKKSSEVWENEYSQNNRFSLPSR